MDEMDETTSAVVTALDNDEDTLTKCQEIARELTELPETEYDIDREIGLAIKPLISEGASGMMAVVWNHLGTQVHWGLVGKHYREDIQQ